MKVSKWNIVRGRAHGFVIVPSVLVDGRPVLAAFMCSGLLDAMKKLQAWEASV